MRFETFSTRSDPYVDEHYDFMDTKPGFVCLKGRRATICPPGTMVRYALTRNQSLGIIISRTDDKIVIMWMVEP